MCGETALLSSLHMQTISFITTFCLSSVSRLISDSTKIKLKSISNFDALKNPLARFKTSNFLTFWCNQALKKRFPWSFEKPPEDSEQNTKHVGKGQEFQVENYRIRDKNSSISSMRNHKKIHHVRTICCASLKGYYGEETILMLLEHSREA